MIMMPHSLRNPLAAAFLGLVLSACGGGGGTSADGGSAPADTAPTPTEPASPGDGSTAEPGPSAGGGSDQEQPAPSEPEPVVDRTAVLMWDSPTTRTDGLCLNDVSGYRVSYGVSPGLYSQTETIAAEDLTCVDSGSTSTCGAVRTCTHTVQDLDTASWYFAIQAVDGAGNVSGYSNEAIKTIE